MWWYPVWYEEGFPACLWVEHLHSPAHRQTCSQGLVYKLRFEVICQHFRCQTLTFIFFVTSSLLAYWHDSLHADTWRRMIKGCANQLRSNCHCQTVLHLAKAGLSGPPVMSGWGRMDTTLSASVEGGARPRKIRRDICWWVSVNVKIQFAHKWKFSTNLCIALTKLFSTYCNLYIQFNLGQWHLDNAIIRLMFCL